MRPIISVFRNSDDNTPATTHIIWSPTLCPNISFTDLKLSISTTISACFFCGNSLSTLVTIFSVVILLKRWVISSICDLSFHEFCSSKTFFKCLTDSSVLLMREIAILASTGFIIKSFAPSSNASVWNEISLLVVKAITGIDSNSFIVCLLRKTSNPSILGMTRSSNTISILFPFFLIISKHSFPSTASKISNFSANISLKTTLWNLESSTISNFSFFCNFIHLIS